MFVLVFVSGALVAGLIAVGYLSFLTPNTHYVTHTTPASLPLPDKPSIVVLPFVNMSKDPDQDYFSDGITEDLTTSLSRLSSLFVISRDSAFAYKGKAMKAQEVSKELGVQYVLEGSVRKADSQVRITVQLIDATTDYHLWTERYDRPLQGIFVLQDEVVQKIVATLKLQLALWEQGDLVRKHTDNLEAYDSFLQGSAQFLRFTQEANPQARQMYEKAVGLDPQYAEADQVLGYTYLREWMAQWSSDPQSLEGAFELEKKALILDPSLPFAHVLLAWVYLWKDREYEQAIAEVERAITLDPNNADSYMTLAETLTLYPERSEEAIGWMEKAMRLNPRYPALYLRILGTAYYWTGRTEEAIAAFERALARNPNWLAAHFFLAFVYSELGREATARVEAAEVLRLSPDFSLEGVRQMNTGAITSLKTHVSGQAMISTRSRAAQSSYR